MGLRKFLQDAQLTTQLTGQFAKTGEALQKQSAQEEFQKRIGELGPRVATGDTQALTQLSQAGLAAGESAPLNTLMDISKLREMSAAKGTAPQDLQAAKDSAKLLLNRYGSNKEVVDLVDTMTDPSRIDALVRQEKEAFMLSLKEKEAVERGQVRQQGMSIREADQITRYQKEVQSALKDQTKRFDSGRNILNILENGGKLEAQAIPFLVARTIQGAGVVTDKDRAAFANAGGIEEWIAVNKSKLESGKLPPEVKETFSHLAQALMNDAKKSASIYIDGKIKSGAFIGIDKEKLKKGLDPEFLFPSPEAIEVYKSEADKKLDSFRKEMSSLDNNALLNKIRASDPKLGKIFDEYLKKNPEIVKNPSFRSRLESKYQELYFNVEGK